MTEFLIKYLKSDGSQKVSDPAVDSFEMKSIFLEGFEFTKDNIALVSDQSSVSGFVNDLNTRFLIHENAQFFYQETINHQVSASFDFSRNITNEVNLSLDSYALQERFISTSGQTDFSVSGFRWNIDDADILVFKNGLHQNQSVSGDFDFWKLSDNSIRFAYPLQPNDRVLIRMERPLSNRVIQDFWREYINPGPTRSVPFASRYNTGADRLWLFRNGVYLAKTRDLGDRIEQFEEGTPSFAILGEMSDPEVVIAAYNMPDSPSFRFYQETTGNDVTIPTYTVGDNRLMIFKNGALMNTSLGSPSQIYTETGPTTVNFSVALDPDDLVAFENLSSITWREDQILVSGTALNFSNPYTIGDERLMVFRDGVLMNDSLTLGDAINRYIEDSTTSVLLEQAASGEVFSAIYL